MFQTKKDFITCSKLIINELGGSPIRSDNVYFANNEQASHVLFISNAKHNLNNNKSAQAVINISDSAMWNSSKPIKFPHLWKLAIQLTLNKAHVIEVTKACKVAFMRARDSFVVWYREERVNWEKKGWCKNLFLKLPANRFWLTSKSCSMFNKVVCEKVMIGLLRVDYIYT